MRVALFCLDHPDHAQMRLETRPAHLAYLKENESRVEMAGPLLDEAGEMCGSLLVLEVEDMAEAQLFAQGDPYAKAGLFARVTLRQWKKTIG